MTMNTNTALLNELTNNSWVRQALFLPIRGDGSGNPGGLFVNARAKKIQIAGTYSLESLNFEDTSLGGNRSINPKYQFTSYADQNLPSLLYNTTSNGKPNRNQSMGMGRYYAEAINSNAQRITLQYGVPAFNSVSNYMNTFYDSNIAKTATTGEVGIGWMSTVIEWAARITVYYMVPVLALSSFIVGTAGAVINNINKRPTSKFYYMTPTMPLYWSSVQTIANALAVNMKLVQGLSNDVLTQPVGQEQTGINWEKLGFTTSEGATGTNNALASTYEKYLPDILLPNGSGIDFKQVATRYQRLADAHTRILTDIRNRATDDDHAFALIQEYISGNKSELKVETGMGLNDLLKAYATVSENASKSLMDQLVYPDPPSQSDGVDNKSPDNLSSAARAAATASVANTFGGVGSIWTGIAEHFLAKKDFLLAELRDGSSFIQYSVEFDQHVSESFTNSARVSDIASTMNSFSKSNRDKLFNIANGHFVDGPIGDVLDAVVSAGSAVLTGVAKATGFSGLAALGGRGFADIPEFWDESYTNLPSANYEIQLRTPYGNPAAIYTDLLLPLATLIAGAAPRATGRNSWTGPYLCKLWQKGRVQYSLGMITQMNIQRGTGNVGWNIHGQPLGIDISCTITNLSKMLYMPISADITVSDILGTSIFDEDNNFTDYMATLAALGYVDQYYALSRWKLKLANIQSNFDSFGSIDNFLFFQLDPTSNAGSLLSLAARHNLGL